MSWTQASDVKTQLQRLWDRGEILAEALSPGTQFPRKLVFKAPTASEMSSSFEQVRRWIVDIRALKNCRVESRVTNHRQLGKNEVPAELWIDSVDDALAWLGKGRTFKQFVQLLDTTLAEQPQLIPWLKSNALRAAEFASVWSELLAVVAWVHRNPRPDVYIREVDLPGIDSKFIEQHKTILADLLDAVLPPEAIDVTASGAGQFAARFGFRTERERIRFRILDPSSRLFGASGDQDISVDIDTFADLRPRVKRVFITENKTNFLAFPPVPESMVVFGAGYGWDALARAHWLLHCEVLYWGDIDTHGFAILNQLRFALPHVRALLMDEETARRFSHLAVEEPKPTDSEYEHLAPEEFALLSLIRAGTLRPNYRLEQERIDWTYARAAIDAAIAHLVLEPPSAPVELWSRDFTSYLRPSRCDRRISLLANAGAVFSAEEFQPSLPRDPLSPLQTLLADIAARSRSEQLSRIPDLLDLSPIESPQSRSSATLSAISSRAPAIKAPLLTVSSMVAGTPVTINAEVDLLRLNGSGRYEAVNFKLARRLADHPEIAHELSLFVWAYEKLTDSKLSAAYIANPQDAPMPVQVEIAAALRVVAQIARARSLPSDYYTPVGWSKCTGCSFRTHCWSSAVASNDVALLPDVDQELAVSLHRKGAKSLQSLLKCFDSVELAKVQYRAGGKTTRVGKRADAILRSARALETTEVIWLRDKDAIPLAPTVAVIDFEGVPSPLVPEESVYLWGLQLFGKDASDYQHSLCSTSGVDADREAWVKFLEVCESVLQEDPSIQFLHYHHYETTMIRKYIERYGDPSGIAARMLEASVDLHTLLRETVCLPVFSYGLKEVERFCGFTRSQGEYGGDWSIAAYLRAAADGGDSSLFADLLRYNAEDIASTWQLLTWLRENTPVHL